MNDFSFTIFLGVIAALVAVLLQKPRTNNGLRQAQRRTNDAIDDRADDATAQAQDAFDDAAEAAHGEAQRIDRTDDDGLSIMVDHEYGSD